MLRRFLHTSILNILLFALLPGLAAAAQQSSNAESRLEQLYAQAQDAQRRGDYHRAAASYREMLKLRPHLPEVEANLGLMNHLLGKYPEAIQQFKEALKSKPDLLVANLFLGIDLLQVQEPRQALTYLQRAHRLRPQDVQSALALGQAYANLRDFQESNQWYFRAKELAPDQAEAWYGLGVTYLKIVALRAEELDRAGKGSYYSQLLYAQSLAERGWFGNAVQTYEKLVKAHPGHRCLLASLGFALLLRGNPSDAAEAETKFRSELAAHPGCLEARLGLARLALERGNINGALQEVAQVWKVDRLYVEVNATHLWWGRKPDQIAALQKAFQQGASAKPESTIAEFLSGALQRWLKNPVGSSESQNKKITAEAASSVGHASPSSSPERLVAEGRYSEGWELLKPKLKNLKPADLALLAECAYASGDYQTAFKAAGALLQVNSQSLAGLYWRARSAQKLSLVALGQVGHLKPNSPQTHFILAEAYRKNKSIKEAEAEYQKVLELQPNFEPALVGLALTYSDAGDSDKMGEVLAKAVKLSPNDPDANYLLGGVLITKRQFEDASPYLKIALKGAPENLPRVRALLAKVYAAQGKTEQAVAELKQSLSVDTDGSYHYQLYQLYRKLGEKDAAAAALKQSVILRRKHDRKGLPQPSESP